MNESVDLYYAVSFVYMDVGAFSNDEVTVSVHLFFLLVMLNALYLVSSLTQNQCFSELLLRAKLHIEIG